MWWFETTLRMDETTRKFGQRKLFVSQEKNCDVEKRPSIHSACDSFNCAKLLRILRILKAFHTFLYFFVLDEDQHLPLDCPLTDVTMFTDNILLI